MYTIESVARGERLADVALRWWHAWVRQMEGVERGWRDGGWWMCWREERVQGRLTDSMKLNMSVSMLCGEW